jgi:hypothetical protein
VEVTALTWIVAIVGLVLIGLLAALQLGAVVRPCPRRLKPTTRPLMLALRVLLRAFRLWVRAWIALAKIGPTRTTDGTL